MICVCCRQRFSLSGFHHEPRCDSGHRRTCAQCVNLGRTWKRRTGQRGGLRALRLTLAAFRAERCNLTEVALWLGVPADRIGAVFFATPLADLGR